ncbi:prophage regulatory protein [Collimonas sp. PA-H2]|uniref:helix-turn-helix transcriptional regulator n=1 Tax=Collimonas sp. PA-H2 TaxID=1881062 RepID=UPI000BF299CC|nr:AlpA family transcriptional regulator [Collimonas sp. PA-H2]PFH08110.1 prophage regulatory protein [Collimonas sp. PA-H2]
MSHSQIAPVKSSIERLPVVMARTGRSRPSIYLDMKKGAFPQCFKVGVRAVGWLSSDIDAWIESRVQAGQTGRAGVEKANDKGN